MDGSARGDESLPPLDDDTLMARLAETPPLLDDAAPVFKGCCIHAVNGVELVADPQGIAYWPAEDALLVADLHLEKGSSFARRGQLVPPYDTLATLRRLEAVVQKWQPARVVALGDSFHDAQGAERLSTAGRAQLSTIMAGRDWVWITGNHDPLPPKGLSGTVMETLEMSGLTLRHDPTVDGPAGEIAGHLHPKARLMRQGRSVRRSCFAASRTRLIMPSFGAYTGGLSIFDRAFNGLFDGRQFHALMRGGDAVYRIAAGDLS